MLKAKLLDAFIFTKTLTIFKLWNGVLLRLSFALSRLTGRYWHWGSPESLAIEPGTICNLMCPECPTGNQQLTRFKQFIDPALVERLIAEKARELSYLQFFFQGEPFMHPRLPELIRLATQHNLYSGTSTNGHYLTPEKCEAIIQAGLKRLIVSVDGTTPETYNQYRVGGNLETVLTGIENLVKAKQRLNKPYPYLILQMVVLKTNEHQIADFKALAKKLGANEVQLKSAQLTPFEKGHPLMPENKIYSRYISVSQNVYKLNRNQNFKCWRTWHSVVVSANGQVLPCCFDKNGEWEYGKLAESRTLNGLFASSNAEGFRKKVWNNAQTFAMCKNCTEGLKCKH